MGLDNLNWWEIGSLLLLGLFIFGPERLPKVISEGVGMLRQLRQLARNATGDLSRELGTDISIEDLHPKTFMRKHLLSEEDEAMLRRPFDDVLGELRGGVESLDVRSALDMGDAPGATPREQPATTFRPAGGPDRRRFLDDAT